MRDDDDDELNSRPPARELCVGVPNAAEDTMQPTTAVGGNRRRSIDRSPYWIAAAAGALLAAALAWTRTPPSPAVAEAPAGHIEDAPATTAAPASIPATAMLRRAAVPEPATPPPATTFADYIDRLVAFGLETSRRAGDGDLDGARGVDGEARALLAELLQQLPEADGEALAAITATADTDAATPAARLRQQVLDVVLRTGLRRRHAEATPTTRAAIDALVGSVLTALGGAPTLAERLGSDLLAGEPWLGPPHERAVLDLVARSGDGTFPAEVATALLSTLWRNLQRTGARSSDQLAGLALLLLDDGNPSERFAAARLLLADDRYRSAVVEHMQRRGDTQLARELATAAAQDLPPAQAFPVIAAASTLAGHPSAPFLLLGHRDGELVRREYEQRLASDIEPRLREMLVVGAGFAENPETGIELARCAFENDPDQAVRLRALFVLTGRAAASLGERAVTAALDDPRFCADPWRLDGVVQALQNLARNGERNAVDRLGQRLRADPRLPPSARVNLEEILAATLPGGGEGR